MLIHIKIKIFSFLAIEQEKEKLNFINGIENFDSKKLKPTETCEKNPLPTKEVIEEEKKA